MALFFSPGYIQAVFYYSGGLLKKCPVTQAFITIKENSRKS